MSASQNLELTAKPQPNTAEQSLSNGDHHQLEDGHTTSRNRFIGEHEKTSDEVGVSKEDEHLYYTGWRLFIIMFTVCLTTLIAALDLVRLSLRANPRQH